MRGNRNSSTLLVGLQISTAAMEINVEIPQKTGNGPGVVAHACNPSTLGGGDQRIRVRGQPQLSRSLSLSLSLSLFLSLSP